MRQALKYLLWLLPLLFVAPASADNVAKFDGYTVYYNAFNADLLDAKIAKVYRLETGCDAGVLTVVVLKGKDESVAADVVAAQVDIIGRRANITMHQIRDHNSLYYVGSFSIGHSDSPEKIDVAITPHGTRSAHHIVIDQKLFGCR